jgi:hypothetical protein
VAVLPADHRLASRQRIALAELRWELFVGTPESQVPGSTRWLTQLCRPCGGFRPKFIQEAESLAQAWNHQGPLDQGCAGQQQPCAGHAKAL